MDDEVDEDLRQQAIKKLTDEEFSALSSVEFKCGEIVGRREALQHARTVIEGVAAAHFLAGRDSEAGIVRGILGQIPAE